ncbi:MAG: stage II sporulation protein M [Candidatus Aenigmatarchaeota archaeon]
MVLESIIPVKKVIKNPVDMFIFSIIISLASIYLADLIFPGVSTGKIITLFITVGITPMIYGVFRREEEIEREEAEKKIDKKFFERHGETILIFSLLFLGVFLAIFVVSIFSDEAYVKYIFEDQIKEIERVTSLSQTGSFIKSEILQIIIENNLRVMGLSFLLSFLLGSGAVIILAWNASILALYLSSFLRKGLIEEFIVRSISLIPHAPVEILAYFLAGIAGGILSVGLIREKLFSREFFLVFRDSLILLGLAVLAVFIGAFIEVFA